MKMRAFSITINKPAIAEMPPVELHEPIVLVDIPEKVAPAMADLCSQKVVGFDTETKPAFKKGQVNNVALMQLSTDTTNYLFRLNRIGIPAELKAFLEDPDITKVGLSVHDDFHVMRRSTPIEPRGFIELQHYVRNFHIADASLQKIYAILFGRKISKKQRLTNWEADTLTPQQQMYAALDSRACLTIFRYLSEGHFDPEASPYRVEPDQNTADDEKN